VINGGYKRNSGKHSTGTFSLLLVRNKARAQKEIDSVEMAKAEEMMFVDFKADILQPVADSSATHGLVAPPSTTTEDMFVMEDNHLGDQSITARCGEG
jgi:hypothetical protein